MCLQHGMGLDCTLFEQRRHMLAAACPAVLAVQLAGSATGACAELARNIFLGRTHATCNAWRDLGVRETLRHTMWNTCAVEQEGCVCVWVTVQQVLVGIMCPTRHMPRYSQELLQSPGSRCDRADDCAAGGGGRAPAVPGGAAGRQANGLPGARSEHVAHEVSLPKQ